MKGDSIILPQTLSPMNLETTPAATRLLCGDRSDIERTTILDGDVNFHHRLK